MSITGLRILSFLTWIFFVLSLISWSNSLWSVGFLFLAILCQFITPNEYRMSVSVSDNKRTVWFDNALKKREVFWTIALYLIPLVVVTSILIYTKLG